MERIHTDYYLRDSPARLSNTIRLLNGCKLYVYTRPITPPWGQAAYGFETRSSSLVNLVTAPAPGNGWATPCRLFPFSNNLRTILVHFLVELVVKLSARLVPSLSK